VEDRAAPGRWVPAKGAIGRRRTRCVQRPGRGQTGTGGCGQAGACGEALESLFWGTCVRWRPEGGFLAGPSIITYGASRGAHFARPLLVGAGPGGVDG